MSPQPVGIAGAAGKTCHVKIVLGGEGQAAKRAASRTLDRDVAMPAKRAKPVIHAA
jgi:hypothetical protein